MKSIEEIEEILLEHQWDFMGRETNEKIYNKIGNFNLNLDLSEHLDINDWFKILRINKKVKINGKDI